MAIYKQVYRKVGVNSAAITAGTTLAARWVGRLRVRMTDADMTTYGACNTLRIVNKSAQKARIHFTWSNANEKYEDIEANSIRNITVDDGINFYGFDIENLDSSTDIAVNNINYTMARVQQTPE
jgi:hypothetical protein